MKSDAATEHWVREARISECGRFRYELSRRWETPPHGKFVLWCMLNPSKADAEKDDPTIRKCVGFSNRWGFGSLVVVNMFAFRATDPRELKKAGYPIGPENDITICEKVSKASLIIVAWGNHATKDGVARTRSLIRHAGSSWLVKCLGKTKSGMPRHPLMVAYSAPLVDY